MSQRFVTMLAAHVYTQYASMLYTALSAVTNLCECVASAAHVCPISAFLWSLWGMYKVVIRHPYWCWSIQRNNSVHTNNR